MERDHPFKTSALFRGGGVSPLPMFSDSRGVARGLRNANVSNFWLPTIGGRGGGGVKNLKNLLTS